MLKSEKLRDIWQKHAEKFVDLSEVQQSLLILLEERLDDAEKRAFVASADKSSPFTQLPGYTRSYKGRNNGGHKSVFVDTGSVMMAFNRTCLALGPLEEKVSEAMADVFEKATDYTADVKAGKFKRFELPRIY